MTLDRLKWGVVPAYLFLCLVIGGSVQGVWANAALQLIGVAIIAVAAVTWRWPDDASARKSGRLLLGLVALAAAWIVIQMLPLPPALWTGLAGREAIARDLASLGLNTGWMPISLTPYDSWGSVVRLLPPLAVLAAMFGLRRNSPSWIAAAIIAAAIANVLLGALQVTSADPYTSKWYLFPQTNYGVAVGFFANANHMASLLLIAIPMVGALATAARDKSDDVRLKTTALVIGGVCMVLLLAGLLLNGSLAGYGLVVPVLLATGLMLLGPQHRGIRLSLVAAIAGCFVLFAAMLFTPLNARLISQDSNSSITARSEMIVNSIEGMKQYGAAGSGVGSFRKVYQQFEDPERVDLTYVNHAHNDYVELALETGVPGVMILILFLAWWAVAVSSMARSPASDQFALAGAIGSAAVLIHSLVDFPLRTAGIAAAFAACLGLIILSRRHAKSDTDLWPTRHVVID